MKLITKTTGLKYDAFNTDSTAYNIYDLCMNYIRDSIFELIERGYRTKPLSDLIEYFEDVFTWCYDEDMDGYELFNVNTDPMDEVDEMHELQLAYKCLNTIREYDCEHNDLYDAVEQLYKRAYSDCEKVLYKGWKRGEPVKPYDPVRYDVLCEQQKIINEGNRTYMCSMFD